MASCHLMAFKSEALDQLMVVLRGGAGEGVSSRARRSASSEGVGEAEEGVMLPAVAPGGASRDALRRGAAASGELGLTTQ